MSDQKQSTAQNKGDYRDVRKDGRLLFRYNPSKNTIQIKRRGAVVTVNLDQYGKVKRS